MKLEKFKEKNIKKRFMIFSIGGVILLLAGIYLYRTFAIFEENREFNIIKGQVPNQKYDVMLSYNIVNEDGTKVFQETMPDGKDFGVSIECDHGASGVWDYEEWGPDIRNLSDSRTKCSLNFKKSVGTLIDVIKSVPVVTSGDGLYEVSHSDASITYTTDTTAINNLKQTELRYAGSNPNSYVKFNNELWRIIGLVNTPDGQRIKIVRNESIGNYSWDSSDFSVNNGTGVNEWSQSKLMQLLNKEVYYYRSSGNCSNGYGNVITSCDFSKTGLTNYAKNMIDTVTWNLGTNLEVDNFSLTPSDFYGTERGNVTGKGCSSGVECNDNIIRNLTWEGKVGLMYPSDYGYATSDRSCLVKAVHSATSWGSSCLENDWLDIVTWLLTPYSRSNGASSVFLSGNRISEDYGGKSYATYPTLHLKASVKAVNGNGSINAPYELVL